MQKQTLWQVMSRRGRCMYKLHAAVRRRYGDPRMNVNELWDRFAAVWNQRENDLR